MKNSNVEVGNKKKLTTSAIVVSALFSLSLLSSPALADKKKAPVAKPKPPVERPTHTVCILLPQLCNK
ncbi:hypothetical protein BK026_09000 [Alteromonas sp. V450]|uniref:hypothetical protein n=1 Tax=Alteromonas sp. V450 TaxID=1912139 RepID=UPI000918EB25|nr:hypothetical protein [Alteromonas sp. V450]OJF68918.1 hypothetical protein BK026_09000 [Alteromonas sp. V450]